MTPEERESLESEYFNRNDYLQSTYSALDADYELRCDEEMEMRRNNNQPRPTGLDD